MKFLKNAALTVFGVSAIVTSASSTVALSETMKIGMPVAQTEFMAVFDQPFAAGFMMGVEEINAAGGIGGSVMLEVAQQDTRSEAAQSMLLMQEMIDNGAKVIFMSAGTSDVYAAGSIASQSEVLAFTAATVAGFDNVTGEYVRTLGPGDNQAAAAGAHFAADGLGAKTAFLLTSPDDPYTAYSTGYFASAFEAKGGEIVGEASFNLFQQEFGNVVQQIRSLPSEPDVIFTYAFEPDFPILVRQVRAAGIGSAILGGDAIDSPTIYAMGSAANGVYHMTLLPEDLESRESMTNLIPAVQAAYGAGAGLDAFTTSGYLTAMLVRDAVLATGSTDPRDLNAWISDLEDYDTGMGPLTYKGVGAQPLATMHFVEVVDGAREYRGTVRLSADQIPAAVQ